MSLFMSRAGGSKKEEAKYRKEVSQNIATDINKKEISEAEKIATFWAFFLGASLSMTVVEYK